MEPLDIRKETGLFLFIRIVSGVAQETVIKGEGVPIIM